MTDRVLIIIPSKPLAEAAAHVLRRRGYVVEKAEAIGEVDHFPLRFDCAILSDGLKGAGAIAIAGSLLARGRIGVAVFYGDTMTVDERIRASNLGTYVEKCEGLHRLAIAVDEAIEDVRLARAVGDEQPGQLRTEMKTGPRQRRKTRL